MSNIQISGIYKSDPFWLDDWKILFVNGNYYRFFPSRKMTKIEKLNAMTRFFIYLLILFILFGKTHDYIYIPLIGIIVIIVIYFIQKNDVDDSQKELFCQDDKCIEPDVCYGPTKDNPFMNILLTDYMDNPNRPKACSILDKNTRESVEKFYEQNLLRDVDDLYNKGHARRQFYTTPVTTIPNDQTGFAQWLYNTAAETCKVDQTNCLKYEDIRYVRFNPNIDYIDRIKDEV